MTATRDRLRALPGKGMGAQGAATATRDRRRQAHVPTDRRRQAHVPTDRGRAGMARRVADHAAPGAGIDTVQRAIAAGETQEGQS